MNRRISWQLRLVLSSLMLLGTFSLSKVAATLAYGQQAPRADGAQAVDKAPEAEVGPRGQHMPREITYSAWRKLCFKPTGAKMVCRTTSSGTWNTGQTAVRVDLIEREGDSAARLQIFLPVGLYLQAGVKVTVDQEPPVRIPYVWCLTNTCIAANLVDPSLIRAMESGRTLVLEVVDSNILTIATALQLDQFAAIHQGAPTQIFEQLMDNE
jgi:invasion protein IalB